MIKQIFMLAAILIFFILIATHCNSQAPVIKLLNDNVLNRYDTTAPTYHELILKVNNLQAKIDSLNNGYILPEWFAKSPNIYANTVKLDQRASLEKKQYPPTLVIIVNTACDQIALPKQ